MISVAAAKKIIADNILELPAEKMLLQDALQLRLADNVYSPVDVPAFPQSSMDGYAFVYADYQEGRNLLLNGVMQAGSKKAFALDAGHAAPYLHRCTIACQCRHRYHAGKVTVSNNELIISGEELERGNSVRATGSAIKTGELALPKNTLLSPGAIGFLAGMGISHVTVFTRPSISIIVTGNELQQPGIDLVFGEVYESNSFALKAALQKCS